MKWALVHIKWPEQEPDSIAVNLPVPESTKLTPRLARMAAQLAGITDPAGLRVAVWSWDEHGYAIYPDTARKLERAFYWDYEMEQT